MKNIFLTTLCMMSLLFFVNAQDKYELAVVGYRYDTPKSQIYISINGEKSEQYDVEREQLEGKIWGVSMNPLIKAVNKMQDDGWEVVGGMNASGLPSISLFYYNLRKKK